MAVGAGPPVADGPSTLGREPLPPRAPRLQVIPPRKAEPGAGRGYWLWDCGVSARACPRLPAPPTALGDCQQTEARPWKLCSSTIALDPRALTAAPHVEPALGALDLS